METSAAALHYGRLSAAFSGAAAGDCRRCQRSIRDRLLPATPFASPLSESFQTHTTVADHKRGLSSSQKFGTARRRSVGGKARAQLEAFGDEVGPNVVPAPPPTTGRVEIRINNEIMQILDLTPADEVLKPFLGGPGGPSEGVEELMKRTVGFQIDYQPANPLDPRELSEYPDIRLWFVRLDAEYPWLPVVLDWKAGEWARYAAMLVPHQMTKREGLVFNPEALELFVMNKMFHGYKWMKDNGLSRPDLKCRDMLKMLGFKVESLMFDILEGTADPKVLAERRKDDDLQVGGGSDFPPPPPPPRGSSGDYVPF